LFGNVVLGTTYYVNTIDALNKQITISSSLANVGVTSVSLITKSGSMNIAAVGWDHVNPGTPVRVALDSSTVYFIEPRTSYIEPAFNQTTMASPIALGTGTIYSSIAYGDGYWIAMPNGNATAAGSSDGSSWISLALPSSSTWSGIAYGNGYWVGIASASSSVIISVANGQGWRTKSLGYSSTWTGITYGNGVFVVIASDDTATAYSTNFGSTWLAGALPGKTTFTASGTARLSTAEKPFGVSSLALDGTANCYISSPSNANYGYGTGDFTIECFIKLAAISGSQPIFDQRSTGTEVTLALDVSGTGQLRLFVNGSYVITGATTLTTAWTHVAVSRASGVTRLFVGGTLQGTTFTDSNDYAAKPFIIGSYYNGSPVNAYIDEFRITKGASRYSTTFTPTTVPFTNDANTVALLHFQGANASTVMSNAIPASTYTSIAYGTNRFVAIGSGTTAAFSTDGISWTASTLPASTTWSSVTYGNGLFVAVSSTLSITAYSPDGATWYGSDLSIAADKVKYGQGVFLALASGSNVAYISADGASWKSKSVSSSSYSTLGFGFTSSSVGLFVAFHGQSTGSTISAGTKTKGRAIVTSGVITAISEIESGSGYQAGNPVVTFTDPNVTTLASVTARVANGVLSSPTFVNRGSGYNTNSTAITISGNGYADAYQTGLTIILNNLTRLPQPGDNLQIIGVSQNYKVTSASVIFGTTAPNIEANVQISPAMTTANSPANGTVVSIRQKYSQARLTGHDFLNIGYGTQAQSNYPGTPTETALQQQNQTVEVNYGRVFFTSTDQDGNFKVGNLFGVQQATGIVTLSATQFGLTGLNTLSLGGIAVGGSSVVVNQFSTDSTFVANSDNIIPTQRAIRTYLTSRLSQGGSNTFTGQLTAGTVVIGGPDKIGSSVPNGTAGSVVTMKQVVYFKGVSGASTVDGNIQALEFFLRRR
jgi:hypothetical protein